MLFVYSQRRDYMFELPVPLTCSVHDVLITLRNIFNLPPPEIIEEYQIAWRHTLSIDGQLVAPDKKLVELVQEDKPIVTLWKSVTWYKSLSPADEIAVLEHTGTSVGVWKSSEEQPLAERIQHIIRLSEQKFEETFTRTIHQLEQESSSPCHQ